MNRTNNSTAKILPSASKAVFKYMAAIFLNAAMEFNGLNIAEMPLKSLFFFIFSKKVFTPFFRAILFACFSFSCFSFPFTEFKVFLFPLLLKYSTFFSNFAIFFSPFVIAAPLFLALIILSIFSCFSAFFSS